MYLPATLSSSGATVFLGPPAAIVCLGPLSHIWRGVGYGCQCLPEGGIDMPLAVLFRKLLGTPSYNLIV